MANNSASSQTPPLSKQEQLDALAMSLEKYKESLAEFEKIESEILKTVMEHTQMSSKEKAREHLHNLLASQ